MMGTDSACDLSSVREPVAEREATMVQFAGYDAALAKLFSEERLAYEGCELEKEA